MAEHVASPSWDGTDAEVAVHVPTFNRPQFVPTLVERLESQTLAPGRFEVVIVDNGSDDETWSVLCDLVARTPLAMTAVHLPVNRGPAGARNVAVLASRAPLLAFTDDDCLPEPGWLEALVDAARDGADLVQGRTEPDPTGTGVGAWARTIRIVEASPLFETCNIAYRRSAFDAAGGFDELDAISARAGGRAFGEDVLLGAAVVAAGGARAFAPCAVVLHRYLPAGYLDHLGEMRNLAGFPALARRVPPLADALWQGVFLTSRTAAFDLAVLGSAAAAVSRRPWYLLAVLPWIVQTLPLTQEHGGRNRAVRLAQLGVADAVALVSLVEGSVRHRRFVL